jgi:hypothetical protein
MTFFYDLNKRLADIADKPQTQQLNERDMSRHAKGIEKYGKDGMEALAKAGKQGKDLEPIRNKYNNYKDSKKDMKEEYGPLEEKGGVPMTGKQKQFAKLAPPADKITFADKIAGAKKEVDEMLGDVAAEAMKSALKGGQKKLDRNHNGRIDGQDLAMLRAGKGKQETDEARDEDYYGLGDTDKSHRTSSGGTVTTKGRVTRHQAAPGRYGGYNPETDPDKDDTAGDNKAAGEKRGRGRPKGSKKALGAKGPSGKSKLLTREGDNQSDEIKQAMAMLKKAGYKVTKAAEQELDEKAVSKDQAVAARIARGVQKGEVKAKPGSASAEMAKMEPKELRKFAKTDTKGLPKKVKAKEEVEETTTSGSVATSTEAPKSKGKGGVQFGKGIYDSMNRELEQMIAESMNISMNMSNSPDGGPSKSLTVTATDDDAMYLGKLLKMAGVGGEEGGCGCGQSPCACNSAAQVDENSPDWPTNTEQSDDALQYSGGLNKPKTTVAGDGQTTVPVTAVQVREEAEEELDEQEQVMAPESTDQELDEELQRIREMAGIREAAKPDYIDLDKDGNKEEPMKKAAADTEKDKKVEESILAMSNLWRAYKG